MDTKALRQKILDLAIRGKLVPQDPNDEPASVLLERIRAEKQQMVKDGRLKVKDIKNDTVIFVGEDNLHYEKFADGTVKCIEDEIPFDVPDGWEWCRFSSFASMMNGTSKRTGKDGHATIVLRLADLGEDDISFADCRSVPLSEADISKYSLQPNDLLFIRVNGSKANVGKSYLFSERDTAVAFCDHIIRARTIPVILPSLLCNYMRSGYARTIIEERIVSAAGQNTISQPSLSDILIPIPPYDEQIRQMKAIEEALSYIGVLEDSKSDLRSLIENSKSKILDLAIRGKLVPQNPDDEPAAVLLERLRAEKEALIKQGKIKREKRESVIFRGEDNSYYEKIGEKASEIGIDELPIGWGVGSFSQVNLYFGENVDPGNFPNEVFELYSVPNFEIGAPEIVIGQQIGSSKQSVRENDILVCKINPRINRVWITGHITPYRLLGSSEWIVFRNYLLFAPYLRYYFSSPYFRELMLSNVSGVGGSLMRAQPESVKKYPVLIPPYQEQRRIAECIDTLFSSLAAIEQSIM